jgi:YD repeat-containing protein
VDQFVRRDGIDLDDDEPRRTDDGHYNRFRGPADADRNPKRCAFCIRLRRARSLVDDDAGSHTWTQGYDTQGYLASITDPLTHAIS